MEYPTFRVSNVGGMVIKIKERVVIHMTKYFYLPVIPLTKYFWRETIHRAFDKYIIKISEQELKEAFESEEKLHELVKDKSNKVIEDIYGIQNCYD